MRSTSYFVGGFGADVLKCHVLTLWRVLYRKSVVRQIVQQHG